MLFASTVTLGVFGLAAVQTERDKLEKVKEEARRREAEKNEGWTSFLKSAFGGSESGSFPARREAPDGFLQRLEIMLGTSVSELSPPMKVITGIVALNGLVFLAWQIPRLQPIMARRFMHWAPDGGRGGTMLTSAFSHMSLPHLAFNMIGLYSFGSLLAEGVFSRDPHRPGFPMSRPDFNAAAWEFTAFYLSGCVLSSLSSQLNNVRMFAGTIGRAVAPSLGASGGVYGIVAASAILFPWTSVNVFMVPIALRLGTVFPVMLAGDLAGMLLRWQTFDHAAHLGGALWGAWYIYYGREVYDKLREKVRAQLWKNEQLKR